MFVCVFDSLGNGCHGVFACEFLRFRLENVNSEFVVVSMSIIFLVFVHNLFCIYTYFAEFFES